VEGATVTFNVEADGVVGLAFRQGTILIHMTKIDRAS